ncbi:long-chain fatty acid--CoA ligase [Rhodococcus sp. 14C212]|uniref:long-chain-fatty-acid--CoA ligase n=1 Tax=Rhodococcus sp. 14C212 TaxID=2711209 RepID=UPI0013ECC5D7|nr:long-chain fatty acid--CoA ligase [Rhodococcus sp. 14C212]NGP05797.1 long-chain fatty acid--CoA ligase [Rhodococcus sp. 14C212]
MLNLSVFLEDSARRYPHRDALVFDGRRLSYSQVDGLANQIANLLHARGIRPGDKIALSCPNVPAFPIVYNGILKAGAVVVPLNILLKADEISYHLTDSDATAYFCFEGTPTLPIAVEGRAAFDRTPGCEHFFVLGADPLEASLVDGLECRPTTFTAATRRPDDTAVILYTSGTTGKPKGAELTHANMVMNALTANRLFSSDPATPDTHLLTLPLFHSFGQTVNMNAGFSCAATLVLLPRFDAQSALTLMTDEQITFFAGVPTMYWALLGALSDDTDITGIAGHLRVAVSGGAALPLEILTQFQTRFDTRILEAYGLSETSPLAFCSDPARSPRPGSIGVPIWGIEGRLVDTDWNTVTGPDQVAEIAIRGHNVMKGYYNRPDATAAVTHDGWFRTGDLARTDEDGFYYIVDRAKDLIIRGGFNVYPREVEDVLMSHPAVSLAAVIGINHVSHGEEIKAFVIREPAAQIDEHSLITWAQQKMASYKYPREIEFVDALPMTATGKILKRQLT